MSHEPYSIAELDARQQAQLIAYEQQAELKRQALAELNEATLIRDASTLARQGAYEARDAAQKIYNQASRAVTVQTPGLIDLRDADRMQASELFRKARYASNNLMHGVSDNLRRQATELKERSAGYEAQREELMQAKRDAQSAHQEADDNFTYLIRVFGEAVEAYEQAYVKFENARSLTVANERLYQSAQMAYRKAVISSSGVPVEYHSSLIIRVDEAGEINLYFGGEDKPDGVGHGHTTLSPEGVVIYDRQPNASHGAHNYVVAGVPTEV